MRKYFVTFKLYDHERFRSDEVELEPDEKANYDTFFKKVDNGLNHWHNHYCEYIISWSLIED
jgi:hypothetical protein